MRTPRRDPDGSLSQKARAIRSMYRAVGRRRGRTDPIPKCLTGFDEPDEPDGPDAADGVGMRREAASDDMSSR
ncbi:hypothetical protein VTJ83DRAFT_3280 [Remersonia thermophila]|uniref:Uncharacterized protein n=1 Tax=Remersonia thermophila TaxID=72144 RepID=A0ABR4DDQ3_9PEZI